jgi:hypothetical protein
MTQQVSVRRALQATSQDLCIGLELLNSLCSSQHFKPMHGCDLFTSTCALRSLKCIQFRLQPTWLHTSAGTFVHAASPQAQCAWHTNTPVHVRLDSWGHTMYGIRLLIRRSNRNG